MKTYRLSAAGRRMTVTLMLAALFIGGFAFWTLQSTLGIRYADLAATFGAALERGFGVAQLIPAAILLFMLVAVPLLLWSLWEEWSTSYTIGEDGLTYRTTAGIVMYYPWASIRSLRGGESEDDIIEVIVEPAETARIRNALTRWLHHQAFGRSRVPIYPGVEGRDELIAQIVERSGLARSEPAGPETPARPQPVD